MLPLTKLNAITNDATLVHMRRVHNHFHIFLKNNRKMSSSAHRAASLFFSPRASSPSANYHTNHFSACRPRLNVPQREKRRSGGQIFSRVMMIKSIVATWAAWRKEQGSQWVSTAVVHRIIKMRRQTHRLRRRHRGEACFWKCSQRRRMMLCKTPLMTLVFAT